MGLGEPDPASNPFLRASLPTLKGLLGGHPPHLGHRAPESSDRNPRPPTARATRLFALDATLGVEGLPQSGTGQIALLTGHNAARRFGRHFGPWPPVELRPLLAEENVLRRARDAGHEVRFANAYPVGYPEGVPSRRVAAPPLAAFGAGILTAGPEELATGHAVASEIENEGWRRYTGRTDIPRVTSEAAGANLARIAGGGGLTFYAHYATDIAGHRGGMAGGIAAIERVDRFLGGLLPVLSPDTLLLIGSDHGNLEDVRRGHTRNPALGLATGPEERVRALPELSSLTQVAAATLAALAGDV